MTRQEIIDTAYRLFDEGYSCSQAVLLVFAPQCNLDEDTAKRISSTFGGGMGRLRQKCGAITGGFMVLGLKYGNTEPKDMDTKLNAYKLVRELNKRVEELHGTSNCFELLKKHANTADIEARKHHKLICRQVVGDTTGLIFDILAEHPDS